MNQSIRLRTRLTPASVKPCQLCGRLAVWELEDGGRMCSLCFLYCHDEGVGQTELFAEYVAAVEEAKGIVYKRDPEGLLQVMEAADHLLGVLVYTSRFFQLEDEMHEAQDDSGEPSAAI